MLALACVRCSLLLDTSTLGDSAGTGPKDVAVEDGAPVDATPDASTVEEASTTDDGGGKVVVPDGATVWSENGHAYLVVTSPTEVSWPQANADAAVLGGHLATITSAQENAFVFSLVLARPDAFRGNYGPWLGGIQKADGIEPDGSWGWVTGEPWGFTAWLPGEPNESNPGEDFLNFYSSASPPLPTWSDVRGQSADVRSFVVEFE